MRDKKIFGFSLGFSTGWGSYGCGCDGGGSRLEVGDGRAGEERVRPKVG